LPAYYTLTNVQRESDSIKSASVLNSEAIPASAPTPTGYRLPTEAEWEYACRASTTTPYYFGSMLNWDKANIIGKTRTGTPWLKRTTTVGSHPANAYGLYDMHGNVAEWCFDAFDEKAYSSRNGTTADPVVTSGGQDRILRGGNWMDYASSTRSAGRFALSPDKHFNRYGLRVVRVGMMNP